MLYLNPNNIRGGPMNKHTRKLIPIILVLCLTGCDTVKFIGSAAILAAGYKYCKDKGKC